MPSALSRTRLARMHDTMAGFVDRGEMPGLVTLVSRRGEIHVNALGNKAVDANDPMKRDTIFRDCIADETDHSCRRDDARRRLRVAPGRTSGSLVAGSRVRRDWGVAIFELNVATDSPMMCVENGATYAVSYTARMLADDDDPLPS